MKLLPMFVAALAAGCASTPAPTKAEISEEIVLESTVQAVNAETREITLERQDGTKVVMVAGPEVRNFAQIAVGDTVRARYRVTLTKRHRLSTLRHKSGRRHYGQRGVGVDSLSGQCRNRTSREPQCRRYRHLLRVSGGDGR